MKIALITCTSNKKNYSCKASEMYSSSSIFKYAYEYAQKVADVTYILSAKYGLISEHEIIEPYNETLYQKSVEHRKLWSKKILESLQERFSLETDEFIILAGINYNKFLIPHLSHVHLPLKGKTLGNWIPTLKKLIKTVSFREDTLSSTFLLHTWMAQLPRYYWNTIDDIPYTNGIYIMFEQGEKLYNVDRIIRIGTHRATNRLKKRLKEHFIKENKDGSILRKNIGLSLLNRENNQFKTIWDLNWSKHNIKNQFNKKLYIQQKKDIEQKVSAYLRNNISFTCIPIEEKKDRLTIEESLIATLNKSTEFHSSSKWLGKFSPKSEISSSGLWNTQGLNSTPLNYDEVKSLKISITNLKQKIINNEIVKKNNLISEKAGSSDIKLFIMNIMNEAKNNKLEFIDIISGKIHKQMKLKNKMPSVCNAMYGIMKNNDVIIHKTKKGQSSTIKIRYYL